MVSKLKIGDEDEKRKKKRRRILKVQELDFRAKRLEELKKDPEKGEIFSKKHS